MSGRYTTYRRDPRWITTRRPGSCSCCGAAIGERERALYWPYNKTLNCKTCGEPAWRRFEAEAADEYAMGGGSSW